MLPLCMLPLCLYLGYLGMLGSLGMLHVGAMVQLLGLWFSLPYLPPILYFACHISYSWAYARGLLLRDGWRGLLLRHAVKLLAHGISNRKHLHAVSLLRVQGCVDAGSRRLSLEVAGVDAFLY